MGVIHKLKGEVTTYIVASKAQEPSVSVRKLAALTSEKFGIKVSKSSVNTVLKNASMSSSVGRRAGEFSRTDRFSIPTQKKSEISRNMQQAGFVKEKTAYDAVKEKIIPDQRVPLMSDPLDAAANVPSIPKSSNDQAIIPKNKDGGSADIISRDQEFLNQVERLRLRQKEYSSSLLEGMGMIFLKAAQWEISPRPFMGDLFQKCSKGNLSAHFNAASDMYLFFHLLGVKSIDDISPYREHALWILNDCNPENLDGNNDILELKQLFQGDNTFRDFSKRNLVNEYGIEKNNAFLEVRGFKLYLEDGTELTINASMSSFGTGSCPAACAQNLQPLNKALTRLSNCLISNAHIPIFQSVPGEVKFDQSFYDMVGVFENLSGKKITKAVVMTGENEEFAKFSTIPAQKRSFIVGVGAWQNEFSELTKSVKWTAKLPFYHEGTDRIFNFSEMKTDLFASKFPEKINDFRVVTIWKEKDKDPIGAILTNLQKESGEKIFEKYISFWPYLGVRREQISNLTEGSSGFAGKSEKIDSFSGVFLDFAHELQRYSVGRFFPQAMRAMSTSDYMQIIYGISGKICRAENSVMVNLDVPKTHKYRHNFEYAVRQVNESAIFDHTGRRLWLKV